MNLDKHFSMAEEGKKIWEKLQSEHSTDWYIVMPEEDSEYNYYALLYLDEFMKKKNIASVCIVTSEPVILKVIGMFTNSKNVDVVLMEHDEIMRIMKYYSLFEFTSKIKIISLKIPYDTCGENLLGVKGVTRRDLFCFDIFAFDETIKKADIVYDGDDADIRRFIGNREK